MEKKIMVLVAFICMSLIVFAQTDAKAKKLLDDISAKYDAYQTIQSNFSFSMQQAQGGSHIDKGTLFLNKPKNQFRIELNEQDIISDGESTWSVLKEDKEVQVSESDNNTESIGPNNLFTFYKNGFTYKSTKDETLGKDVLNVIELTPTDTKTNYAKIKLRINKNKHIHDVVINDKSGARYTYTINTLYVNHRIPATKFIFNASNYPNYEIVDLR
ncbi:LolA family protein [Sphingobacterium chuzhouense]|uniref:Outer membrane lipoprotein carrier protein LolA n=1 Tax=Sphingobacterium chuzhouense TaxID=1742264 RepID=A0ABR7XWK9_9SPHI|nr:outer membrane lipoprotein carrier protein LolA [Sphingobacterium chuzhouense]MBD1423436.1 outer membrane lipoprotein carrier protein LolA [Sphingobacterium chuzhouense]